MDKKSDEMMKASNSNDIIKDDLPPNPKSKHPTTETMVDAALRALDGRTGTSFVGVKKYISNNYTVDIDKLNIHLKKYLKKSIDSGKIIKPKGVGMTGSFRLSKSAIDGKKTIVKSKKTKSNLASPEKKKDDEKKKNNNKEKKTIKKLVPEKARIKDVKIVKKPNGKLNLSIERRKSVIKINLKDKKLAANKVEKKIKPSKKKMESKMKSNDEEVKDDKKQLKKSKQKIKV